MHIWHFFPIWFCSVHLQCDIVLDAAHRKSVEPNVGPHREDIVESIIFKSSDVVVVHFKDVDLNYAKKGETFVKEMFVLASLVVPLQVQYKLW